MDELNIERETMASVANDMNNGAAELNDFLRDIDQVAEDLSKHWVDADPKSKVNECLEELSSTGRILEASSIATDEISREVFKEDAEIGLDENGGAA